MSTGTEPEVVETLTAYSDMELSRIMESVYDMGRADEKKFQKKSALKKKKEQIESLKLCLTLAAGMIGFPALMIVHYLIMGY